MIKLVTRTSSPIYDSAPATLKDKIEESGNFLFAIIINLI